MPYKHAIVGKIEWMRGGGRRGKQLLVDLKEKTGFWKLKYIALDRILWRNLFGRGYGPVVRHYKMENVCGFVTQEETISEDIISGHKINLKWNASEQGYGDMEWIPLWTCCRGDIRKRSQIDISVKGNVTSSETKPKEPNALRPHIDTNSQRQSLFAATRLDYVTSTRCNHRLQDKSSGTWGAASVGGYTCSFASFVLEYTYLVNVGLTICLQYVKIPGHAVARLGEALRFKPEGRGFDSRWGNCNFLLI